MKFFFLFIAIITEVIATSALKSSNGFTKTIPSIVVIVGYGTAFYFLSLALKYIPIGIVYAIWSGMGIFFISVIGFCFFKQKLDFPAKATKQEATTYARRWL
ncbi:MAG TPA: QacE family quaternary ammonium compound efflux SMR transporter [Fibrobacteres bacterium]|nr:QacE family quaternary ammonium compound efflux SMR transporter [Fibrobacterota bacterium]